MQTRGIPDANGATLAALFAMQRAGREYLESRRVLERAGLNLVSEVLRGQGEFVEREHYPRDDVHAEALEHADASYGGAIVLCTPLTTPSFFSTPYAQNGQASPSTRSR